MYTLVGLKLAMTSLTAEVVLILVPKVLVMCNWGASTGAGDDSAWMSIGVADMLVKWCRRVTPWASDGTSLSCFFGLGGTERAARWGTAFHNDDLELCTTTPGVGRQRCARDPRVQFWGSFLGPC